MIKKTYTIDSLFCDCGGSNLSVLGRFKFIDQKYKKPPTDLQYAIDVDQKAINTYNHNF